MQDDLDAFLGDGRIVDEAAGSKALDVVEGEFQREADKLGLPSNADEEISGSCLVSLHFFLAYCCMLKLCYLHMHVGWNYSRTYRYNLWLHHPT